MSKRLTCHLHGRIAGHFSDLGAGKIGFSYTQDWFDMWRGGTGHPISLSLPVSTPDVMLDATSYVAGLLPDSTRHRSLIAEEMGIGDDPSDFAFLAKMGRDSAGALMVIPEDEQVARAGPPGVEWLDEAELAEHLRGLPRRPLLIDEEHGVVLSLAGVNDKAAVVVSKGRIGLPTNGQPSTHIIKIDIPGLEDSVKTEYFTLQLARAAGLRVPNCRLEQAEDQSFMLMQRYDRAVQEGRLVRIHQEDFCQALGVMPGKKYQRYGGPGWAQCFELMGAAVNPTAARDTLLKEAIFQFLAGNPDAHAKNYSFTYRWPSGAMELSPLYDVNNAAAFRNKFRRAKPLMAMFIGEKKDREEVTWEDWEDFATECGLSSDLVADRLREMATSVLHVLPAVREACPEGEAIDLAAKDIAERCAAWGASDPEKSVLEGVEP